jgi:hypothetical protein
MDTHPGFKSSFVVCLRLGDTLGYHADRGVVEPKQGRDGAQRVPVDADSQVDLLLEIVPRAGAGGETHCAPEAAT